MLKTQISPKAPLMHAVARSVKLSTVKRIGVKCFSSETTFDYKNEDPGAGILVLRKAVRTYKVCCEGNLVI